MAERGVSMNKRLEKNLKDQILYVLQVDRTAVNDGKWTIEFVTDLRVHHDQLFIRGLDMDGHEFSNFYDLYPGTKLGLVRQDEIDNENSDF